MRTRDSANWMWEQALDLLEQADRLQRHFFEPVPAQSGPCWQPPVDVIETDGDYWILIALPGVSPQRVRAVIESGGTLVVQGERPMPAKAFPGAIRRLEIPYGRFERRVAVPSGRFELREQRFENGCLVVGLRRLA